MGLQGKQLAAFAALLVAATLLLLGAAVLLGSGGLDAELIATLRAPRVLAAAGVGALLALSGLAMQVLLRNPLADPYVLGTSGGASVGALLALMGGVSLWIGAAAGALLAGLLLLALARSALAASDDASARLILTGAMLADSVVSLRDDRRPLVTVAGCLVRAALLPPLFLAAARWLPVPLDLKRVLAVQAAMPCAMVPVLLSRHFRGDTGIAVQIVLASTALGLLTIPLWLRIGFSWLGL